MAVTNQKHIERQVFQLLERVALIHNQDGRLRIDREIYENEGLVSSLKMLFEELLDFDGSADYEQALRLQNSTKNYITAVDVMFREARPRFLTTLRSVGGKSFVDAYKRAQSLERILDASLVADDLSPTNIPDQKPSPIYAKIEGQKIVLDFGRTLQPLLSIHSIERTKSYLKEELIQLVDSLHSSNVDRRLTFEISRLSKLMDFEDDSGAIVLGLHTKKVTSMAVKIEHEVSSILGVQMSSTLTQVSHFASQYKDWIDFLRNANQYPAKQAVEGSVDQSVEKFAEVLEANPSNVDEEILATVRLIESSLSSDGDVRAGAIYAAVRGFENICIVAVKFAFDQVIALLKETGEKLRNYTAKTIAAAIIVLTMGMIGSFMPVIRAAPELNWILENLPKIEKLKDLIK
jgi:hypothetical protein